MIIDLDNLNAGTWFPLDGGGQVCIRVCAGDEYQAIRKQAVTSKREIYVDPKSRQAQIVREEIVDDQLLSSLLWDFCIVEWKNLLDARQQPIPCTKEMKLLLMGRSPRFFTFVSECLDKLREAEKGEAEALQKN